MRGEDIQEGLHPIVIQVLAVALAEVLQGQALMLGKF